MGTELIVEVDGLAHDGRGVGRLDGKAVFIEGALPGEQVRIDRLHEARKFSHARLVEVLRPSPARVEPGCPSFGTCGGCSLQHLSPEGQLAAKQADLGEQLARLGKVAPGRWLEPVRGPAWRYRRRARLGVKWVERKQRVLVGFRERAKPYITDMAACPILAAPVDELLGPLGELVAGLSIRNRLPQIEVSVAEAGTVLVFRILESLQEADKSLLRGFAAEHDLRIWLQPAGLDSIVPLDGDGTLPFYTLPGDLRIEYSPVGFVQVNAEVNRKAVALAVDLLDPDPEDRVLDLFCGVGNFTLPLARRAGSVLGVEGEPALVDRAAANAGLNGVSNASFLHADLAVDPVSATWAKEPCDLVLLDPPRAGAEALLPMLGRLRPRRIVYVSCHPASLARDAGLLVHQQGYALVAAGVMDMFPHTSHVESVATFEPR